MNCLLLEEASWDDIPLEDVFMFNDTLIDTTNENRVYNFTS